MAISRVWIEDGCISCGLAEAICPEVFRLPPDSPNLVIEDADLLSVESKIKEAAKECPMDVIKYEEISP